MNIPVELQQAIDALLTDKDSNKIRNDVSNICRKYKYEIGQGKRLVKTVDEVIAYAVARMPATCSAVYQVLSYMNELYKEPISSLLDFGSGTGAVSWAANEIFLLSSITCVEREKYMIDVARKISSFGCATMKNTKWIHASITSKLQLEKNDLVTAAYMMNELEESEKRLFLEVLWNSANKVIVIIEPGTTIGYQNIMKAREYFISEGANIIAPCTHNGVCALEKGDWCHFSCRLQRNKLQRYVKGGDAPFEDEKFSYIVVTKSHIEENKCSRIIRHPLINKGYISVKVCSDAGVNAVKVTSKNKEAYKSMKKADWGDLVTINFK